MNQLSAVQDQPMEHEQEQQERKVKIPTMSAELDEKILEACDEIEVYRADIKVLQARVQEVIERIEAEGIPRFAFKKVLREMQFSEDQLIANDTAALIMRRAVGKPMQADMFADGDPTESPSDAHARVM